MHETLKGDRSNTLTDNLGVRGSAPPLSPAQKEDLYQRLTFDQETLINLCQRWQIQEFALFGSVLREDFRPDSDIDVLITFLPNDPWVYFNLNRLPCLGKNSTNESTIQCVIRCFSALLEGTRVLVTQVVVHFPFLGNLFRRA